MIFWQEAQTLRNRGSSGSRDGRTDGTSTWIDYAGYTFQSALFSKKKHRKSTKRSCVQVFYSNEVVNAIFKNTGWSLWRLATRNRTLTETRFTIDWSLNEAEWLEVGTTYLQFTQTRRLWWLTRVVSTSAPSLWMENHHHTTEDREVRVYTCPKTRWSNTKNNVLILLLVLFILCS
jgi:hypothetical protein